MMTALRRLVPRTLFAQMVLLLAGAIVVSKLGSWYAYMDERTFAVRQMHVDDTIARTAAALRLVATAPDELRKDVLDAASGRDFKFWLDREGCVKDGDTPTEEALAARDRLRAVAGDKVRDVQVEIIRPDVAPAAAAAADGTAAVAIMVAAQLADGTYLNAATSQTVRPPGWGWPATMSTASSVVTVALVAFFISRRISRPLRAIGDAAEKLGRGESGPPLDQANGPDEVRRAAAAFNAMGARLRRFVDDRTRMLAAVSHDLRTPITNLRLRVELLEDGEDKARMLETLDELRQTAEATLAFAREEAGEDARLVDLASLVCSVCDDLSDAGQPVTCTAPERLPATCRPAALRRAVRNLVENAVAYGGSASVTVLGGPAEVRVAVEDQGPGIPAAELERVFEPFVRLEASRNRRTGGVGLGLSIARSIARAHGGDIALENRPGGGLRAVLTLPGQPATTPARAAAPAAPATGAAKRPARA